MAAKLLTVKTVGVIKPEQKRDRKEMQDKKQPELYCNKKNLHVLMGEPVLAHSWSSPLPQWKTQVPDTETDSLSDLLPAE